MIKRVNFTGRRRIPKSRVQLEVEDGSPRRMTARFDWADMKFPNDAAVVLEAMSAGSNVVERIECGTFGTLQPTLSRALSGIEGENLFFTLKVIDRTDRTGRILGIAERLRPENVGSAIPAGRRGILPIEPADLKQELWKLDFKEHDVVLFVNQEVPNLKDSIRSDPAVFALVFPEVVRSILAEAIHQNMEADEDDDRWPVLWLRFGRDLHPEKSSPPKLTDSKEDRDEWIDDVVEAFCEVHQLRGKFMASMLNKQGGEA